ncbi:MAG TPA: S16 family serine protease [Acidimicrobiia bacterium]|jgi:PDZ domain-containing protein
MTPPPSVPTGEDTPVEPPFAPGTAASEPRRRKWLPIVLLSFVGLLAVVAIAGAVIRLPYRIFAPGDAKSLSGVVHIDGARTYQHHGNVYFLTVSVSNGRPNVWAYLEAKLDHNDDLIKEQDYTGGRPSSQIQQQDQQAMNESQVAAEIVALTRLGYHVSVTGGGAIVDQVAPGSAATGVLRAGDVITAVAGKPVGARGQLGPLVRALPVGHPAQITITRKGDEHQVTIVPKAATSGPFKGKAQLGVFSETKDLRANFPVNVKIDQGPVSGPSAGLAFTLGILDKLTPGDLTGGHKVAVTGTIDEDGTVGPIGGVRQKTVAAERAGATLFIVPTSEAKDARKMANSKLQVVGVDTIDQALGVLRAHGGAPLPTLAKAAA